MRQNLALRPVHGDHAIADDNQPIHNPQHGRAMGCNDYGHIGAEATEHVDHSRFRSIVERSDGLIEQEHVYTVQQKPGEKQPLRLPARQTDPAFQGHVIQTLRKAVNEFSQTHLTKLRKDSLIASHRRAKGKIFTQRPIKQPCALPHQTDIARTSVGSINPMTTSSRYTCIARGSSNPASPDSSVDFPATMALREVLV